MESPETKRFPHVPGIVAATAQLIAAMKDGKPGDVMSDERLAAIAGKSCSPGGDGYANLATAIKHLEGESTPVVWRREKGARCIRCLDPHGCIAVAHDGRKRIHRISKRSVGVLNTVKPEQLPEGKRTEFYALVATQGTMAWLSSTKAHRKLVAKKATEPADMRKLLASFPE